MVLSESTLPVTEPGTIRTRRVGLALRAMFIAAPLCALYWRILLKWAVDCWQIADYSQGLLVPPFAFYLAWTRRDALLRIVPNPRWGGVFIVAMGIVLLILGVYGAELFLSRVSLVVVLAGMVAAFGGWRFLKELRFPLLVVLLAIPIPAVILNQITLPLQNLAARLASHTLPLFGIPVFRDGNIIELPSVQLDVAEACSGIRSLTSLFTLSLFYGYFAESVTWRRLFLVAASIPIAILANAARIVGTGLAIQYWDPEKGAGFFHEFSGWTVFLVAFACICVIHLAMYLGPRQRRGV